MSDMDTIVTLLRRISSGVGQMSDWVEGQLDDTCTQDDETADTTHVDGCGCNGLVSWSKWQDGYDEYAAAMDELRKVLGVPVNTWSGV